jgi:hypothetical protein
MQYLRTEFVKNANKCGKMTFKQIAQGVNPKGKNVYVYSRAKMDGTLFSFEVLVPNIKRAGDYKVPTPVGEPQRYKNYPEDLEEYPGASLFGFIAWEFRSKASALERFNELVKGAVEVPDAVVGEGDDDEESTTSDNPQKAELVDSAPKRRGRQKGERPVLNMPTGLFSTNDLCIHNKVEYPVAAVFVKEGLNKVLWFAKEERRSIKGPMTKLYSAIPRPPV